MFTGLIQHVGAIRAISASSDGARLSVDIGPLAAENILGASIAVDGCCLTIVNLNGTVAGFDAVPETLRRTTLGSLFAGSRVNLESALRPDSRLGGHFVQGHIDTTAKVQRTVETPGARWAEWHLQLDDRTCAEQIVEKGSIALDGISLTVAGSDMKAGTFWVALIPETLQRTTIGSKKSGAAVNVETDILGKYVLAALKNRMGSGGTINEAWLRENGF